MRLTEILHHLSTCHSTLSLGVRGYKLCISKSKVIEVVQDFFHPPKKEKDFLYFWSFTFLPVTSYFQGIKSIVGPSHSSPSVLHSSPHASSANYTQHSAQTTRNTTEMKRILLSTRQNELHGSRRALHCKLHATLYTQHYTLHYTQHYRNAARGSILLDRPLFQRLKFLTRKNAYGQNIRELLPADSLQFFTQAHRSQYRRKKRMPCIFGPSHFCPSPATSKRIKSMSVLRIVPPVCFILHLHTAEHEAK